MTSLLDTDFIWGAWRARQAGDTASPAGFAQALEQVLDLDLAWIDHADIYDDGAVETLHGKALAHLSTANRQRLRVISKCGVRFPSPGQPGVKGHHYRSDANFIRQQADASLKRLACERIDLYLLHRPDYLMRAEETARALEDLVASGKIATYGASNFSPRQIERLQSAAPAPLGAHQIELSPLSSAALDNGVVDQALSQAMPLLIWSPLAGGRLFGPDETAARVRETLMEIARKHGADDIAAAALAWLRRLPGAVIPILGTMKPERLTDQVTQARGITMEAQDWYAVLEAGRAQRVP